MLEAIAERAGGNPLFLRSLLDAARSGRLGATAAIGADALPDSVEGLVTSQIDQLPTGERALLRYAAVLGVTFAEEHLREMLGRGRDADGAGQPAAAGRLPGTGGARAVPVPARAHQGRRVRGAVVPAPP